MDRRAFFQMAAAAAAMLAPWAEAEATPAPGRRLFAQGPLAGNAVASEWQVTPRNLVAPDTKLLTGGKPRRFSDLTGKIRIVSLWAEWCAPCLLEAHDLAVLRSKTHDDQFDILGIAQGTKLDLPGSHAFLARYGAAGLPTWIEPGGAAVAVALATPPGAKGFSLPCNLLVDQDGRVRGRTFGSKLVRAGATAPAATTMKAANLAHPSRTPLIASETMWSLPDAAAFIAALKAGALNHA